MKVLIAVVVAVVFLSQVAFAADVTIKGVPDGISEQQVQEWVAILVERAENAKVNQIKEVKEAVTESQKSIDSFRKANSLSAKFEKAEVVEPVQ
jgi:uncharacterized GH25 family protein